MLSPGHCHPITLHQCHRLTVRSISHFLNAVERYLTVLHALSGHRHSCALRTPAPSILSPDTTIHALSRHRHRPCSLRTPPSNHFYTPASRTYRLMVHPVSHFLNAVERYLTVLHALSGHRHPCSLRDTTIQSLLHISAVAAAAAAASQFSSSAGPRLVAWCNY